MSQVASDFSVSGPRMPVLFLGHGSPMNAIEENEFSRAWEDAGRALPRPQGIVCVSAHWETPGTRVTAMPRPRTIHDFYGFPAELNRQTYPAPGSPALAALVRETAAGAVAEDTEWGLDHGAWSVLKRLFPAADVPVVQLSLDAGKTPAEHYELARSLRPLRDRGVLLLGSGNVVHNLAIMCWEDRAYPWARAFDAQVRDLILAGDHEALIAYEQFGDDAARSIPTNEHYLPLLYALALQHEGEAVTFFADKATLCSISMRSLRFG